jgi:Rrf2 family protein
MNITTKGEYALKALIELAIEHARGNTVTPINDVAKRKDIPKKYLEQILLSLKNAGILESKRGVGGGYSLSKSPEDISVGEIIRAAEGTFAPVNCVDMVVNDSCPEEATCGLYSIMLEVRNAVSSILDNASLEDVSRKTLVLTDQKRRIINYAI